MRNSEAALFVVIIMVMVSAAFMIGL